MILRICNSPTNATRHHITTVARAPPWSSHVANFHTTTEYILRPTNLIRPYIHSHDRTPPLTTQAPPIAIPSKDGGTPSSAELYNQFLPTIKMSQPHSLPPFLHNPLAPGAATNSNGTSRNTLWLRDGDGERETRSRRRRLFQRRRVVRQDERLHVPGHSQAMEVCSSEIAIASHTNTD